MPKANIKTARRKRSLPSPIERGSPCPVACALDLFGDWWTLLIIRDLFLGSTRFKDFASLPEGIPTNILSDWLERLVERGIVQQIPAADGTKHMAYQLTAKGKSLGRVLACIRDWGLKWVPGSVVMPGCAVMADQHSFAAALRTNSHSRSPAGVTSPFTARQMPTSMLMSVPVRGRIFNRLPVMSSMTSQSGQRMSGRCRDHQRVAEEMLKGQSGAIETPMVGRFVGEHTENNPQRDWLAGLHPVGRIGTSDEIAQAVIALLENPFITGTTLAVDGGWMAQ